ncbi:MAG: hypothetical protein DHS20C09_04540 [marine bacterium B5-7]|nr:MAG: hypothetical protein DHS20C09_04540 [marine bacterium B5-7]
MLQKKNSKPAGKALAAGLLAAWMSVTPVANAAGPNEEPANDVSYTEGSQPAVTEMTAGELSARALMYSKENNVVVVFINTAPDVRDRGVTGQQIATIIGSKFQADGIPVVFAFNNAEAGETSVDFAINGTSYAGWALDRAVTDGYELVSSTYVALQDQDTPTLAVR